MSLILLVLLLDFVEIAMVWISESLIRSDREIGSFDFSEKLALDPNL